MAKESLNLSIDSEAIERAREYSRENDTSISQLVNDFLGSLPTRKVRKKRDLPPITRSLLGIASGGADVDEEDFREYLWEKYWR